MTITKEQQRQEAIARLEILRGMGLHPNVLKEFKENNKLNYSENMRLNSTSAPIGVIYWIDNVPEYAEAIRQFEEENEAVVYHATLERTNLGTLLDLFFVGRCDEEWEQDRMDLKAGYSLCYVKNFDCDFCSEFGTIGFKVSGGGLVRIA